MSSSSPAARLAPYAPTMLSIMRIVAGLIFLEHGTGKLLGFPAGGPGPEMFTLIWFAGVVELVGGLLITLGLFTRVAAFFASGEMAVAYFTAHFPSSFFPAMNKGDAAILYCFLFLYLVFAGAGPLSLDAARQRK